MTRGALTAALAVSAGIDTTFQRNVELSARYSIAVKTCVPIGCSGCAMVIASSKTGSKSCRTKIFFSFRLTKIAIGDFLIGAALAASAAGADGAGVSGAAITGAAGVLPVTAGVCAFGSDAGGTDVVLASAAASAFVASALDASAPGASGFAVSAATAGFVASMATPTLASSEARTTLPPVPRRPKSVAFTEVSVAFAGAAASALASLALL